MTENGEKFCINYTKIKPVDWKTLEETYVPTPEDAVYNYNPYSIRHIQNYNPIYNKFFKLNENNYNRIALNHPYHFVEPNTVVHLEKKQTRNQPIFIKYSPLLDPYRYMTGKYKQSTNILTVLPKLYPDNGVEPNKKIIDANNASYIDNFFCFLSSKFAHQHRFVHGLDYYGSWLGIQDVFKVNVSDDLEFLQSSDYFLENLGKLFTVSKEAAGEDFFSYGSRANRAKLQISNDDVVVICPDTLDPLDLLEPVATSEVGPIEEVYEKTTRHSSPDTEDSAESSDSDSDHDDEEGSDNEVPSGANHSDEDGEGNEDDDEDVWTTESEEENLDADEPNQFAYVKQFPVQMICLEKCDGTLDELFVRGEVDENAAASALFQVIMTLIAYQKSFHFTHNDLHTNNIMFSVTSEPYIYYIYKGKTYRVPTYGKIFKIIDFGRSIYKYNGHLFCSDSFAPGGDASTQYNTEPYLNDRKPRLDPNYSFDLCRLGCSIYDFIIDCDDPHTVSQFNDFQKTIYRWCCNDDGKNVLYKRNREERYPSFKLYKMIARTVHRHLPDEQLKFPFFQQFLVDGRELGADVRVTNIDLFPTYC
jgi:hypothetical protein